MPLPLVRAAWLALALLLAGCASHASRPASSGSASDAAAPLPAAASPATLLLVSLDGVRAGYLHRGHTPNLDQLAREGASADGMRPSYPSLTFPNHYTLVTGLRPDHHGIINNTMQDDQLGGFALSNRDAVADARWWSGEPIWVGAERAGLRSATMFWPGSEAAVSGVRPGAWYPFDKNLAIDERIGRVIAWLDLPPAQRPRVITLYLEQVDTAGHDHGPDSPEVAAALGAVDAAIGRLRQHIALHANASPVNLIVVSDHGMAATSPDRLIAVESIAPPDLATAIAPGQVVGFVPRAGQAAAVAERLLRTHEHFQCWRKQDMPPRWHYGSHPRIPPFVCQADEGWLLVRQSSIDAWRAKGWIGGGAHGYDPALPSMEAIFLASGPAFRPGARIAAFDNVDVYPLLARLLGIPPAPHDGNPETLLPLLRPTPQR